MRTTALAAAALLFSAPAVASAFERFVNPFATCAAGTVGGRPQHGTIQEAVDAASPGDAIRVCPGTYFESVTVPTTTGGISLTALGGVLVVPEQESRGLEILANDVTVEGFAVGARERTAVSVRANGATIRNNRLFSSDSVGLGLTGDRNRALNNELIGGTSGLFLRGNQAEVSGNRVLGGFLGAIHADGVDREAPGTVIHHNVLLGDSEAGIRVRDAGAATIRNNTVQGHPEIGIRADLTTGLTIVQNLVRRSGIGIRVGTSVGTTVRNNSVRENAGGILATDTTAATIVQNLVQRNGFAIFVDASTDCRVGFNSVTFNTHGIELAGIDGCVIERNNVSRNEPPDCVWDGAGSNTFVANSCATETPFATWD